MASGKLASVARSIRAPFVLLTPVCVFLGLSAAIRIEGQVDWAHFSLVLMGAVFAHMSVNLFNEYFDFKSGLDLDTVKTPFSGGSGSLLRNPGAAAAILKAAVFSLLICLIVGTYFVYELGVLLVPLGALGVLIIVTYTQLIVRHPLICLIAPGLGFGPLMVAGSYFCITGSYHWFPFYLSLAPFFLVSNLLLLNQFPDLEPDRRAGRNHLPIALGVRTSARIFAAFNVLAYLAILIGIAVRVLPLASVFASLPAFMATFVSVKAGNFDGDIENHIPVMGIYVLVVLSTPALLGISLII